MFAARLFPSRMFARRYFPAAGASVVVPELQDILVIDVGIPALSQITIVVGLA